MNILIKNARLVDKEIDGLLDLYIEDGKIKEVGEGLDYDCQTLDAEGLVVMPAFTDLHVHFRDPGFTHKEDLETGSRAALRGGYTFVTLMGNTNPISSNMEVVDYVLDKARDLDLIDVHQVVSLTEKFDGRSLGHLDSIDRNKVRVLSEDGHGVISNKVTYDAMVWAKERDFIIMTHAEDMELTPIDYRISENIISLRDLYLASVTGVHLHLSHVSTKEAIEAIRIFKARGTRVSCEVAPHHIALADLDYRVNPPIRQREDNLEIIRGIQDGTVDAIATDHAPHTAKDKENGAPGMVGLETAFSICYSELVEKGHIGLQKLTELMSTNPSRIMGLNKGRIKEGYQADLVIVDLDKEYTIDASSFASKGRNTPFDGRNYKGQVVATIRKGLIKYKNEEYPI